MICSHGIETSLQRCPWCMPFPNCADCGSYEHVARDCQQPLNCPQCRRVENLNLAAENERLRAEILDARRGGRPPEAFWLTVIGDFHC